MTVLLTLLLLFSYLLFSRHPIIETEITLSVSEVKDAKHVVKQIIRKFSSTQNFVEISLSQRDIDAVASTTSHLFTGARLTGNVSSFGVTINGSKKFKLLSFEYYLNLHCILSQGFEKFEIDNCQLGSVPISGSLIRWGIKTGSALMFGHDVSSTVTMLVDNAEIKNNNLVLTATKSNDFKGDINASIKDAASLVRSVSQKAEVNSARVNFYIEYLDSVQISKASLSYYLGKIFAQVQQEITTSGNVIEENTAALWALVIVYANPEFSRYIGAEKLNNFRGESLTLRGRHDLMLHFLYSIFLEQLGRVDIGVQIGEIKELLDTNKGGSGFSFADLAADKAGAQFSARMTTEEKTAERLTALLANSDDESLFFPLIHDLPEGFKEKEFNQIFTGIDSPRYKTMESEIDKRLTSLPLYLNDNIPIKISKAYSEISGVEGGQWLLIDTHIHSRYSDGKYTIPEITDQAVKFGCDAIAITDHGDHNLKKVTSAEYVDNIAKENNKHTSLTIIPGLEWNIPPFMGREHATVLLPDSSQLQRNLSVFRGRYDSWGQRSEKLLSAKDALNWLNKNAWVEGIAPVVIYNHPSRKVEQTEENKHDLLLWRSFNDLVIGFSGAPGHQRKREDDNGSYEQKEKTINGWDPSIAIIGGEWDQLLQEGLRVSAARAASDFHNLKMDYWPCQFSSTHLFAENNSHNQVLLALQKGNFWAQHGRVLDKIDFSVSTFSPALKTAHMGETLILSSEKSINVTLSLLLNEYDWQNMPTSLDEVELIVITEDDITVRRFDPLLVERNKHYEFSIELPMATRNIAVRWRGRSKQPEKHDYMFYTNPIYVTRSN